MVVPLLQIHYLGHSSFVLRFASGVSLLTDYGKSNAFGLDSPIYDLGDLQPDVVLYSHHDDDHDRGNEFPGATILDGAHLREEVGIDGVVFEPIRTSEHAPGDNTSFLILFEDLRILFAGDCQGDIVSISQAAARERIEAHFPKSVDLLLVPIDWTHPIAADAAAFVKLLRPRTTIPMHYWSRQAKDEFLSHLRARGDSSEESYVIHEPGSSDYSLDAAPTTTAPLAVVDLEPAPWQPVAS